MAPLAISKNASKSRRREANESEGDSHTGCVAVAPARLLDFGVFVCGVYFSRFIATRARLADDFRFLLDFPMTTTDR